jgi:hypothetical protein
VNNAETPLGPSYQVIKPGQPEQPGQPGLKKRTHLESLYVGANFLIKKKFDFSQKKVYSETVLTSLTKALLAQTYIN